MVLQETTIDYHHIAVAVTSRFRGKVEDRACHFFLIAHPLLRDQFTGHNANSALPLLRHSSRQIRWEPAWRNNIAPNIKRHEERTQILHQMVRPSFASVVDKARREPVQAAYTPNRDDLARRRAFRPTLVTASNSSRKAMDVV